MRWLGDLWFRVRALFARRAMQRGLDDEVAFHLEMEAKKLEATGLSPEEAWRRARIGFGGEDRFKESARESWGVGFVTDLGSDVRFAARQLSKHPAFTALAVLTLALGIGGTVALFSVMHRLMIRPLPVPDEERVVVFWMDYNWRGEEFDLVRDVPGSFESVAAFSNEGYTLRTDAGSTLVLAAVASVELFDLMGVRPLLGRGFEEGDDRAGAEPVVVLTHGIWEREFGADPGIVGRRVTLDGEPITVVGVMPEGFWFPTPDMEVFVPLNLDPADPAYANNGWLVLAGRLREGVAEQALQDDLRAIARTLDERYDYPEAWDKTRNPYVTPLREYVLGNVRPALTLLLSAVGVLLLMACVNVAALLLTRTVDRTREMSVRAALGAGRSRLARQVLTESVLLGLAAGMTGMALAIGLFDVLVASLPIDATFRATLSLEWVALVSALVLSVVTGALVSLAPIRNLLRGELAEGSLTDRRQSAGAAHAGRLQGALVIAQVLLAVVLMTGATLLVRSVSALRSLETGFRTEGVVAVGLVLGQEETTPEERAVFFDRLLARVETLPGVTSAGLINRLPLRDGGYQGTVNITDRPDLGGVNRPNAMYRPVSPGVFDLLGLELVAGRRIEPPDAEGTPTVAVVNETFARMAWGEESPIGRTYQTGFAGDVVVVGVVRDFAVTDLVGAPPMTALYSWDQTSRGVGSATLMARTGLDPAGLAEPIRALVRELEPRAVVGRMTTMDDVLDDEMAEPLRLRFFLGLFGLLGVVLGTVGVYGVVSHSVQCRHAEYGIRLALGAAPARLLREVVRDGMLPVSIGVAGGAGVALLAARALASFLFDVAPTDPASLVAAAAALLGAGVGASVVPAWRASRTPPAVALRSE
jgi:predicted permease